MTPPTSSPSNGIRMSGWTCPVCGKQSSSVLKPNQNLDQPLGALKNHILAQADEQHGGLDTYPDDLAVDDLDQYVDQPRPFSSATETA